MQKAGIGMCVVGAFVFACSLRPAFAEDSRRVSREALEGIIEDYKLVDIPPSNGKYTWNKKRIGKKKHKRKVGKHSYS